MSSEPLVQLGALLTAAEAAKLANRFADGDTLTSAMQGISASRRNEVRAALEASEVVPSNLAVALPVLRSIEGAATRITDVSPVWTLPGHLADYGNLTTSIKDLVLAARYSVVCSTFNFQKSSALWDALREVAARGTVDVRVYLDTEAATSQKWSSAPSLADMASQLAGAHVYRTRELDGKSIRNHAKFIAVDHQFLIVTSANFSISAEQFNVELGLRVDDAPLTQRVEQQLIDLEKVLYEPVA